MTKRLRVGIARLLTTGTDCTVVRSKHVEDMQSAASELVEYVDKSGALNDSRWIHAHRRIHALVATIRQNAEKVEVGT